jgi:hypothetical protein
MLVLIDKALGLLGLRPVAARYLTTAGTGWSSCGSLHRSKLSRPFPPAVEAQQLVL